MVWDSCGYVVGRRWILVICSRLVLRVERVGGKKRTRIEKELKRKRGIRDLFSGFYIYVRIRIYAFMYTYV